MRNIRGSLWYFFVLGSTALAALSASCGDNSADCGEGTTEVSGQCVPDATCGPGTVEGSDGTCVPDGTVICGDGTVYDAATGECVVDPSACAEGTVLVGDQCIPVDDTFVADAEEGAEPNGLGATDPAAGEIVVPSVGEDFVIHGCINPTVDETGDGQPDPDFDAWVLTASEPTLLDITADGVDGLAAGFVVIPLDQELVARGWQRFGVNLVNDTSARQVFLPKAGTYLFAMSDSRALFLDAAGGPDACYFTTIRRLAMPTPTALSADTLDGEIGNEVQFYSRAAADGDLVTAELEMGPDSVSESLVIQRNSLNHTTAEEFSQGQPMAEVIFGGLDNTDQVVIAVDTQFNYGLAPQAFELRLAHYGAVALPTDGSSIGITDNSDSPFGDELDDFELTYFDVGNAGDMVFFDLDLDQTHGFILIDDRFEAVGAGTFWQTDGLTSWVHFPRAGRYYLAFGGDGVSTFNVTATLTSATPMPITIGTLIDNQPLSPLNASWFVLRPGTRPWLNYNAGAENFGGNVELAFYDNDEFGAIDAEMLPIGPDLPFSPAGSTSIGQIVADNDRDMLIMVSDTGTSGVDPTFDLSVQNRVFDNLMTVTETTGATRSGQSIASAGSTLRYFVRANPGHRLTVTVTPESGFDVMVRPLDEWENGAPQDVEGEGGAETITVTTLPGDAWAAFEVTGYDNDTGTFSLEVEATDLSYTVAGSSLAYNDICNGSNDVTMYDDGTIGDGMDEGISAEFTLPFAFDLHREAVTHLTVLSNGWVSFEDGYSGIANWSPPPLPNDDAFNGLAAPYWDDLYLSSVCLSASSTEVIVQWVGTTFLAGDPVEFQLRLSPSGNIDFIYGPNHLASLFGASFPTVGTENLDGTWGQQISDAIFDPESSLTFAP